MSHVIHWKLMILPLDHLAFPCLLQENDRCVGNTQNYQVKVSSVLSFPVQLSPRKFRLGRVSGINKNLIQAN